MKHYTITVFAHRISPLLPTMYRNLESGNCTEYQHFYFTKAASAGVYWNKNTCFRYNFIFFIASQKKGDVNLPKKLQVTKVVAFTCSPKAAPLFVDIQSKCGMHNSDIDCHKHALEGAKKSSIMHPGTNRKGRSTW